MKKYILTALLFMLCFQLGIAQNLKSVSILGDSYSTYEGYIQPDTNAIWYWAKVQDRTDVTSVRETWWHKFIKENGYKLCVNNSYSGATICNTGYKGNDYTDRSFVSRVKKLGCPDVIFVFGATNDSWAGSPLGEYKYDNWTQQELFSFRPAMAYMLGTMIDYYPNAEIYFVLNEGLKDEIAQSAKAICSHYNIDCIELKGIDKKSGHPSVKGMAQINEQIKAYLASHKR